MLIKTNHLIGNESSCSILRHKGISSMGPHRRLWSVTNIFSNVLRVETEFHKVISYQVPSSIDQWHQHRTEWKWLYWGGSGHYALKRGSIQKIFKYQVEDSYWQSSINIGSSSCGLEITEGKWVSCRSFVAR